MCIFTKLKKLDSHCFSVDDLHLQSSVNAHLLLQLGMLLATSSFTTKVRTRDFYFFQTNFVSFSIKNLGKFWICFVQV